MDLWAPDSSAGLDNKQGSRVAVSNPARVMRRTQEVIRICPELDTFWEDLSNGETDNLKTVGRGFGV